MYLLFYNEIVDFVRPAKQVDTKSGFCEASDYERHHGVIVE